VLRNLFPKRVDKYEFIEKYRTSRYAVSSLCRVLKTSEAAFYAWRTGKTYQPSQKRRELAGAVKEVFYLHRRRYGARRISAELQAEGVAVGRRLAAGLMKEQSLTAIAPKRFVPRTTDSKHNFGFSPNLSREPTGEPVGPGQVIVGDITYLPLQNGRFCYLATFQDKFTRRIVGWQVSERMTAQLVIDAFNRARRRGLIKRGAIIHTDRGSQYAAVEYRRLLYINGLRQSMSGKGNCYDNAQAESFFSRFKAELVEGGIFESVEQARTEIFSYIEGYYNRIRRHSSLGYLSPLEFEKQLKIKNQRSRESFVSCFS
jgi:transposase InsO family protein